MKAPKTPWVLAAMVFVEGTLALVNLPANCSLRAQPYDQPVQLADGVSVRDVVFSPDSQIVYGIGRDGEKPQHWQSWVGAWSAKSGGIRWRNRVQEPISDFQLSPSGAALLTWPENGAPLLWNTATGHQRSTLELNPAQGKANEYYFTPDERRVLGCFQEGIQVWNASTGKREAFWRLPKGESGWPSSLKFSADGAKVLVGIVGWSNKKSPDNSSVQLWDTKTGRVLEHYTGSSAIAALAPAANKMAVIDYPFEGSKAKSNDSKDSYYRIALHDYKSGRKLESPRLAANFEPESLEYRADGSILCKGMVFLTDPKAYVWNVRTNRLKEKPVYASSVDTNTIVRQLSGLVRR